MSERRSGLILLGVFFLVGNVLSEVIAEIAGEEEPVKAICVPGSVSSSDTGAKR